MKVTPTAIPGVLILEPKVFGDERGFFMESFNQKAFIQSVGQGTEFLYMSTDGDTVSGATVHPIRQISRCSPE